MRFARFAGILSLLLAALPALAREEIVAFEDVVAIQADGSLRVAEAITVVAEGRSIKRGIYRDFPTDYRYRDGSRVRVGFQVLSVTRDGKAEPWFTERRSNGVRVYIGQRNADVPPGQHRYVLQYATTRQLGFFADHDELYWNVTGNGWDLPIAAASAKLTLPVAVPAQKLQLEGWTGAQGSAERAVVAESLEGGGTIRTTRRLGAREGMTIAFAFPKGVVLEPTLAQRVRWWAADNLGLLVIVVAFVALWLYYLVMWWRDGRDPPRGVVIPEYEAPDGLPPSLLVYARDMGYASDTFASDVMHLAERGCILIRNDGKFLVKKLRDADASDEVGTRLMSALFAKSDTVRLDTGAHKVLGEAQSRHEKAVELAHRDRWFALNLAPLRTGAIVGVLALLVGTVLHSQREQRVVVPIFLTMFIVAVGLFLFVAKGFARARAGQRPLFAVLGVILAIPMAVVGIVVAGIAGWTIFGAVVALAATVMLFAYLMPAYKREGRRLVDRIEGFVDYLSVAEKDDLSRQKAPTMTGERFAQFLPYAQALGVEQAWTRKLVEALGETAAVAETRRCVGRFYHSDRNDSFTPSTFTREVGSSFNEAISSAATPPGSSSGSSSYGGGGGGGGGGGRSGGGGGGGGGGGW